MRQNELARSSNYATTATRGPAQSVESVGRAHTLGFDRLRVPDTALFVVIVFAGWWTKTKPVAKRRN
jgi:hypothetical protein